MANNYLALLRGINVSGKNPIKMKEFQGFLQENGFSTVTTYIQSGNIVLKSQATDNKTISDKISTLIKNKYGYDVPIIVLQQAELETIVKNNPFNEQATEEATKVLVSFLTDSPSPELLQKFLANTYPTEEYKFEGKHVYLFCKNGYGKAKINNNFIESKLKVLATTRNWKTVLKLYEMMTIS